MAIKTISGHLVQPEATGLWELPAYGMVLDLRAEVPVIYDRTHELCWKDVENSNIAALNDMFPFFLRSVRDGSPRFAASPDGTTYETTRLSTLPPACKVDADTKGQAYIFDAVAQSLNEFYPFRQAHHVDFAERAARLRPRALAAKDSTELLGVLRDLFRHVADPHTSLSGTINGKPFRIRTFHGHTFGLLTRIHARGAPNSLFLDWLYGTWMPSEERDVADVLVTGTRQKSLGGAVVWGRLPGGVGYLAVNRLAGYTEDGDVVSDRAALAAALDRALSDLAGTRALVLDISHDLGGDDELARDVAGRFAKTVQAPYTKRAFHGGIRETFPVAPAHGVTYIHPIILLTSELTSSAAEVLTLCMRAMPDVTQAGETTQGVFSDSTEKTLPNGWTLAMSTEVYHDNAGRSFEGLGLPPSIAFGVVFPGMKGKYGRAILQADDLAIRAAARDKR